jgi:hypothetical protein
MSTDPKDREQALKRLSHIRISLIDTILLSAVNREAQIDLKLAQNPGEQRALKNFIRGLSIIYYFSFLQSNLVETQWEQIKSPKGTQRPAFKKVDWDKFDLLKYARDCFAHNWDGRIFPESQDNTKYFLCVLSRSAPTFLSFDNDKIILSDKATFECLQVVKSIIEEGDIAV